MPKEKIIVGLDKNKNLSARGVQDEIFVRMPAGKKVRLASDFSGFLLKLNQLNKQDGIHSVADKNSQNSGRVKN